MAMVKGRIRIGHRPDADDAFMVYGLIAGKVDAAGLTISHVVEEIQALNERAMSGELEVTAMSTYAFFEVTNKYALMTCGASVGEDYGPVIVSKSLNYPKELVGKRIAVPGKWTTAQLLLKLYGQEYEPVFVPHTDVIPAVLDGRADGAIVIHEEQVTFESLGLRKVIDLGEWYFEMTRFPIPLGVNVVRKSLGSDLMRKLQRVLRDSIVYGLDHREEALEYALKYARGHPKDVIDRFVGMYVNDYTVDMGKKGKDGLLHLHKVAKKASLIKNPSAVEFVPK